FRLRSSVIVRDFKKLTPKTKDPGQNWQLEIGNASLLRCTFREVKEFVTGGVKNEMAKDVFILGGKRTPMGEYVGALKDVSAIDLGAIAARGALEATGVAPDQIDHTIMGNALQTSGDAIYGARHVALKAGVPF